MIENDSGNSDKLKIRKEFQMWIERFVYRNFISRTGSDYIIPISVLKVVFMLLCLNENYELLAQLCKSMGIDESIKRPFGAFQVWIQVTASSWCCEKIKHAIDKTIEYYWFMDPTYSIYFLFILEQLSNNRNSKIELYRDYRDSIFTHQILPESIHITDNDFIDTNLHNHLFIRFPWVFSAEFKKIIWNRINRSLMIEAIQHSILENGVQYSIVNNQSEPLRLVVDLKVLSKQTKQLNIVPTEIFAAETPYLPMAIHSPNAEDNNALMKSDILDIINNPRLETKYLRKPIVVHYIDSTGQDLGGLRTEMFIELFRTILNDKRLFFIVEQSNTRFIIPVDYTDDSLTGNKRDRDDNAIIQTNRSLQNYHLLGVFVGMMIFQETCANLMFPLYYYERLIQDQLRRKNYYTKEEIRKGTHKEEEAYNLYSIKELMEFYRMYDEDDWNRLRKLESQLKRHKEYTQTFLQSSSLRQFAKRINQIVNHGIVAGVATPFPKKWKEITEYDNVTGLYTQRILDLMCMTNKNANATDYTTEIDCTNYKEVSSFLDIVKDPVLILYWNLYRYLTEDEYTNYINTPPQEERKLPDITNATVIRQKWKDYYKAFADATQDVNYDVDYITARFYVQFHLFGRLFSPQEWNPMNEFDSREGYGRIFTYPESILPSTTYVYSINPIILQYRSLDNDTLKYSRRMVTIDNFESYQRSFLLMILFKMIRKEWNSFSDGFYKVIGDMITLHKYFNSIDLQQIICGVNVVSLRGLESHTLYVTSGFDASHPTIIAFWEIVYEFTPEQVKQFLQYVTSNPNIPTGGFKAIGFQINRRAYQYHNQEKQNISGLPGTVYLHETRSYNQEVMDLDRYGFAYLYDNPGFASHACFQQIDMSDFIMKEQTTTVSESERAQRKEVMKHALMDAISNNTGFSIA